ncbi:MAG: helix-turn-helix domain-containing protein [Paludibacter sp.]|nr:helix-turn-helix domain-containing protein [Paludibacter sp.]
MEKYVPRPDIALIFHFKHIPVIEDIPPVKLEPYFLAPVLPHSIYLSSDGEMESFIVICKPTVLSRILKLDFSPSAKHDINLPRDLFQPLWLQISQLKTSQERMSCFAGFAEHLQSRPYHPDAVDILYDCILEKGTTTHLKDIVTQNCWASQRTLERNFIRRTGVNPKTLARIVRLHHLWTKINAGENIDYQYMVFDGNYFDQSHFINDFKNVIGETPGSFFKRNLNVVRKFSGK